jgi:flagellar hook-associated protein 1 FlgK
MGVYNTLNIGRTGLKAASYGIEVTAQNVTNASTEGYVRRQVVQKPRVPSRTQTGVYMGQGVGVEAVHRSIDRNVTSRSIDSIGSEAQARTAHQTLQVLESSFREGELSGLADRFDAFYDALQEMTLEPGDHGLRQASLSAGEDFASALSRTALSAEETVRQIEARVEDEIVSINQTLDNLEFLNRQISESDAISGPADLLDQRDVLMETIAQKLGVSVEYKANGQVNLWVGGHALVQGVNVRDLSVSGSAGSLEVKMSVDSGTVTITAELGGELGGLLEARAVVQATGDDLDTFAADFAASFNAQHALGFDRTGTSGGDFFSFTAGSAAKSFSLDSALAADPDLIAAAASSSAEIGDGGNLSALIDIESSKLFDGGTKTSRDFIASIYSDLGSEVSGFANDADTFLQQLSDITSLKDAVSAVDLDEEAVSLIKYQASYEAAARVVSIANELLDTLMRM